MDETPEELKEIGRQADAIDVHQYRKRFRLFKAIGIGALGAGLVWLVLIMLDSRRNPCERVRDFHCDKDPGGQVCAMYKGIWEESEQDQSTKMRQAIRAQCQTKIERLKAEQGVELP
jgi:hypothetical protein